MTNPASKLNYVPPLHPFKYAMKSSGGSRIPTARGANPKVGRQVTILAIFCGKNCMNMNNFGPREGTVHGTLPLLNPPMIRIRIINLIKMVHKSLLCVWLCGVAYIYSTIIAGDSLIPCPCVSKYGIWHQGDTSSKPSAPSHWFCQQPGPNKPQK